MLLADSEAGTINSLIIIINSLAVIANPAVIMNPTDIMTVAALMANLAANLMTDLILALILLTEAVITAEVNQDSDPDLKIILDIKESSFTAISVMILVT